MTPIYNDHLGQHPRVYTHNCPNKPRYAFVRDIEAVLSYLSKLPGNLSVIIRALSHKLALLIFNRSIKSLKNMLFNY